MTIFSYLGEVKGVGDIHAKILFYDEDVVMEKNY